MSVSCRSGVVGRSWVPLSGLTFGKVLSFAFPGRRRSSSQTQFHDMDLVCERPRNAWVLRAAHAGYGAAILGNGKRMPHDTSTHRHLESTVASPSDRQAHILAASYAPWWQHVCSLRGHLHKCRTANAIHLSRRYGKRGTNFRALRLGVKTDMGGARMTTNGGRGTRGTLDLGRARIRCSRGGVPPVRRGPRALMMTVLPMCAVGWGSARQNIPRGKWSPRFRPKCRARPTSSR